MPLIYKTLFEIKLMHEYFLTRQDGKTIFENNLQQDRLQFLNEEFENDKEPVNSDIDFQFPDSLKEAYEGAGLKLLPTYSGCRVVIRVFQNKLADESLVFTPAVSFPADQHLYILLNRRGNPIDSYSNSRMLRPYPSLYFFSNTDVIGPKTFPFLTNSVPAVDNSFPYEQGELSVNAGTIQQYFSEGGVDTWTPVTGAGFVSENDRILLPAKFRYSIPADTNLTEANFKLKDSNGNEVASVSKADAAGISKTIELDFTDAIKPIPTNNPFLTTDLLYTLEATASNGYARTHPLLFANELISGNPWAVVQMRATSTPDFNLFANDGFLIRRRDPLGAWTPAPVFEIPVKSRLAYWRFINNQGKEMNISPALAPYVNKENKVLVTKQPRALAKDFFLLRKQGSSDTIYVPNPTDTRLIPEPGRRFFLDIKVARSELFPVIP